MICYTSPPFYSWSQFPFCNCIPFYLQMATSAKWYGCVCKYKLHYISNFMLILNFLGYFSLLCTYVLKIKWLHFKRNSLNHFSISFIQWLLLFFFCFFCFVCVCASLEILLSFFVYKYAKDNTLNFKKTDKFYSFPIDI